MDIIQSHSITFSSSQAQLHSSGKWEIAEMAKNARELGQVSFCFLLLILFQNDNGGCRTAREAYFEGNSRCSAWCCLDKNVTYRRTQSHLSQYALLGPLKHSSLLQGPSRPIPEGGEDGHHLWWWSHRSWSCSYFSYSERFRQAKGHHAGLSSQCPDCLRHPWQESTFFWSLITRLGPILSRNELYCWPVPVLHARGRRLLDPPPGHGERSLLDGLLLWGRFPFLLHDHQCCIESSSSSTFSFVFLPKSTFLPFTRRSRTIFQYFSSLLWAYGLLKPSLLLLVVHDRLCQYDAVWCGHSHLGCFLVQGLVHRSSGHHRFVQDLWEYATAEFCSFLIHDRGNIGYGRWGGIAWFFQGPSWPSIFSYWVFIW